SLILLKTKTHSRRVACLDYLSPDSLGQRPHELLGQLVKERLSRSSIKAAYSTSDRYLVNGYF
ncbi:hypothetical protein, partial [Marinobacter daqiaonensis]|uniref:hypothetical protein n=1 Tax=Marinobacter daqiaonensis TaxID=650891 RepID=UPI001C31C8B3